MSERAEKLRAAVNRQAWHSGSGVPPHAICAAIVRELGITREMVADVGFCAEAMLSDAGYRDAYDSAMAVARALATLLDAAGVGP